MRTEPIIVGGLKNMGLWPCLMTLPVQLRNWKTVIRPEPARLPTATLSMWVVSDGLTHCPTTTCRELTVVPSSICRLAGPPVAAARAIDPMVPPDRMSRDQTI